MPFKGGAVVHKYVFYSPLSENDFQETINISGRMMNLSLLSTSMTEEVMMSVLIFGRYFAVMIRT